jgi:hypothetical protein
VNAPPDPAPPAGPLDAGAALVLGSALVALADAVVLGARLPRGLPADVRALTHLFAAGHFLALGVLLGAVALGWRRFGPRARWLGALALVAAAWAAVHPIVAEDASGLADRFGRKHGHYAVWLGMMTFAVSLSVPVTRLVGRLLGRSRAWGAGVILAMGVVVLNGLELDPGESDLLITQSYPGLHLLVAALAALLAGSALDGPAVLALRRRLSPRALQVLPAVAALWVAGALAVWPRNAVGFQLDRYQGAALFPFLGPLHTVAAEARPARVPEAQRAWFEDRTALPALPPSQPALLPEGAVVILLGIDSMRAELLADEQYRKDLPELFRLRDESVHFRDARAAGSSTAPSLASLFAGVYYSSLYWTRAEENWSLVFPHDDPSPRFPQQLVAQDVTTITFEGAGWLTNRMGIVRGFMEERSFKARRGYAEAPVIFGPLLARLRKREAQSRFVFVHLLDAHSPYSSAGKRASPFLGYLAELAQVDLQIGVLRQTLEQHRMEDRTAIVIMSDHGEAFGEHGTRRHASTVYDELLRVPLLVHVPGVKPRVVDDPVTLLDLGPTLLDLMGAQTPGRYLGQSLVGYLRGEDPHLTRPIAAEARLKHAMVMPDGFKVIHDTRSHVVQIYDLKSDPGELHNLYREGDPASEERLDAVTTFFRAHALRRPGYTAPYRKW